jgi:hypothetical protein
MGISRKTKNAVEEGTKNALDYFNYYSGRIDDLNESVQNGQKRLEVLREDARKCLSNGNHPRHDYLTHIRIPAEQVWIQSIKTCISDLLLDCRQLNRTVKVMKRTS